MDINAVVYTSTIILFGLVLFQFGHYVIGAGRFWKNSPHRFRNTILVAGYWMAHGLFFVSIVLSIDAYEAAVPWIILGLYSPTLLTLLGIRFSRRFKGLADTIPLKWAVADVEGPARIIVGSIFIVWFFAGELPGVFAWVAGPGDIISGILALYAVRKLKPIAKMMGIETNTLSHQNFEVSLIGKGNSIQALKEARKNTLWVIAILIFGIVDFIAAPLSSEISIILGKSPEALGQIPLTLVPLVLVPQVLLLEVLALRQSIRILKTVNAEIIRKS